MPLGRLIGMLMHAYLLLLLFCSVVQKCSWLFSFFQIGFTVDMVVCLLALVW